MHDRSTPLSRLLIGIKDALNHLEASIGKYQEAETAKRQVENQAELKTEVRLPPEVTAYYESENTERKPTNRRERIRLVLEFVAVGAAIFLAVVTLCTLRTFNGQLTEMRRQTRQSLESFGVDERAWIEIENIKLEKISPATEAFPRAGFIYQVYAKNVGKTVARDIVLKRVNVGDANTGDVNARAIQQAQDNLLKDQPNAPSEVPALPMPKSLAPNTPIFLPFTIGGGAPKTYGSRDKQTTWYDYLVGRFDYSDVFGVPHWLKFCYVIKDASGSLGYCETGNDEDKNPEPPPN